MIPEAVLKSILIDKAKSIELSSIMGVEYVREAVLSCAGKDKTIGFPVEIVCDEITVLRFKAHVSWEGASYLYMPGDYDAILYVDGERYIGLDRFGREIPLQDIGPGEHLFEVRIHPHLCLGEHHRRPRIEFIAIFTVDPEIRMLGREIR